MDKIYFIKDDNQLVELNETPYGSEEMLQALLAKYPNVLAGEQINPDDPRRWVLIAREMRIPGEEDGTGRWSVDHLFLDQDGIPTLVEVKRSTDTRIRREVVGQMLDYAANAVTYWPLERIRTQFEERCMAADDDPNELISVLIGSDDEHELEQFWESVKTNFQAEKIRLVFLADVIPNELRRIVEFLNNQMERTEVLAVELKQYAGGGQQTLVPRVLGQTAAAQQKKSRSSSANRESTSEEYFLDHAKKNCEPGLLKLIQRLLDFAKSKNMAMYYLKGTKQTNAVPGVRLGSGMVYPVSIKGNTGRLVFQMTYLHKREPFNDPAVLQEFEQRLNQIPGYYERGGMTGFPYVDLTEVATEADQKKLVDVLDWVVDRLVEFDS